MGMHQGPHTYPLALDSVLRPRHAGQTNPAGGPCPGDYSAGDVPDGDMGHAAHNA
jgi:hypothetical protein